MLELKTLENWLWEAACRIRGDIDAPKYKDYILPLIFIKRLSDVFEDEVQELAADYGDKATAEALLAEDPSLVRFYLPPHTRWGEIARQAVNVGEYLTGAMRDIARENEKLQGVIDSVDFNATTSGQREIDDDKLKTLVDILGRYRLGIEDVEPDILGRAYEYLLRKFAEGSGQSAGEFYTPREVAILMARILDPEPNMEIYDPCAGSGGLLIKFQLRFNEKYRDDRGPAPLRFYGQETQPPTYAMARMNMFIHDMEAEIYLGNTMVNPRTTRPDGSLRQFDRVTANPMWNQKFNEQVFENDTFDRFEFGYPPSGSADWAWVQHMYKCLNRRGRMAVVLDTGAVSRGSGNTSKNRERDIRRAFVERDLVEMVILLPENMFYNTSAPGIILVINKDKAHKNEILLINGSRLFKKGRPKNYLDDESIRRIGDIYLGWQEAAGISTIIGKAEAVKNDCNLSPSRYVSQEGGEAVLPLEEAVSLLQQAEAQRQSADEALLHILDKMGLAPQP
jgi:type I restriction enzyme M protein